jgi:hypothetical protein
MVKLTHFTVKELVPKSVYDAEGDKAIIHFKDDALQSLEDIHSFFSSYFQNVSVLVNTWSLSKFEGPIYNYRGYRPPECKTGAPLSQHKIGNAFDVDIYANGVRVGPDKVRKMIVRNRDQFPKITRMEDEVNWVHFDCKPTGKKGIVLFNP